MLLELFVKAQSFLLNAQEMRNERGATAAEYGLLVALIAAVIIVTVKALGGKIDAAFQKVVSNM